MLRRITDRLKARFNVSVAEVEDQDLWQRATIALAVVSADRRHVDEQIQKIIHFVEEMYVAPLINRELEILAFGDQLFGGGGSPDDESTLELPFAREDRSLAEAEGMAEWDRRPGALVQGRPGSRGGGDLPCPRHGPGPASSGTSASGRSREGSAVSVPGRPERVGAEIQAAVGELLARGELRDPRIGYITITGVKMSPDLRVAKVFWSSLGTEAERKETQAGLDAAKGFVRREVTARVKLRVSPEVFFVFDGAWARETRSTVCSGR